MSRGGAELSSSGRRIRDGGRGRTRCGTMEGGGRRGGGGIGEDNGRPHEGWIRRETLDLPMLFKRQSKKREALATVTSR